MDLSVPRNIQTDVENLKNITLFTVDELESVVSERLFSRKQELPRASLIVNEVYEEFVTWLKTLSVTPTIADLKHLFEDIKNIELSKIETRYDEDTLSAIDKFSSSLVKRILRDPISSLKSQATNGHYSPAVVDAIRSMYRLDEFLDPVEQD
jgi:glutamyl-tRNA reductase